MQLLVFFFLWVCVCVFFPYLTFVEDAAEWADFLLFTEPLFIIYLQQHN